MSDQEPPGSRPQGSRNDVFNTGSSYFPPYNSNTPASSAPIPIPVRPVQSQRPSNNLSSSPLQSSPLSPYHQTRESPQRTQRAKATSAMKGKLTTAMIQDKLCWICFTGESDPDSASKGRWVHPCKCALFCHETCLLAWIAEYQTRNKRSTSSPVSCPQCNTPYNVKQSRSLFLELMEGSSKAWDRMAVRVSAVGLGGGVATLSYFYGASATRAFLGPQAFNQLILRPFDMPQSKHLFTLPLVAPALILTRTNLIDGLFPLLPLALLNLPPPSFYTGDYTRMLRNVHVPGPATTCILLPFVRLGYLKARSWLYRMALTRKPRSTRSGTSTGQQTPRPATPAPNTPAVQFQGQFPAQPPPPPAEEAPAEAHEVDFEQGAHLTLSLRRLAGMVVGALLWPYLSAGVGELLLQASQYSEVLRTMLGVRAAPVWKSAMLGYVPLTSDISLDPAWWRNFIGGCLCVLANDSVKLTRMLLQRRRLESRSIEEVDIDPALDVKVADPGVWRAATS